jgi:hypothetical protein
METTKTQETIASPDAGAGSAGMQALDSKEASMPADHDNPGRSGGAPSHPSADEDAKKGSKANRLLSYIDAATLLALTTAVLYFWGYAYISAYFAALRLPSGLLTLPFGTYVIAGWNYGWVIIFFVAFLLFLRALFSDPMRWLWNKIAPEHRRTISAYRPGFAIGAALVVFLYVGNSARQDGTRAAASAFARRKRVEFVTAEGITLPKPLYLLGYTGGKYVVYHQPDEKAEPRVYLLGEGEVRRPSFPGDDQAAPAPTGDAGTQETSGKGGMLTQSQRGLLGRVAEGERTFKPAGGDSATAAYDAFQPQAEELIELGDAGCLLGVQASRESHTGKHYFDLVSVRGLSAKGRRALQEGPSVK